MIHRGDIYHITAAHSTGSEQRGDRPAIVVSNDMANRYSPVIQVVFLTTRNKKPLPTHIPVTSCDRPSTALCEQITPVDVSRVGAFAGRLTPDELRHIDRGLSISLGIAQ